MAQPDTLESLKIQNIFKNFPTVLYVITKQRKKPHNEQKRETPSRDRNHMESILLKKGNRKGGGKRED